MGTVTSDSVRLVTGRTERRQATKLRSSAYVHQVSEACGRFPLSNVEVVFRVAVFTELDTQVGEGVAIWKCSVSHFDCVTPQPCVFPSSVSDLFDRFLTRPRTRDGFTPSLVDFQTGWGFSEEATVLAAVF